MSFANPTPLRIGMSGTLAGRRFRVAGRVVMGMEDAGETYYWNEFNLVNDAGESATLVYEETERDGEWRMFTLFEPEYPITAEDAASKRVGDPLNLDGTDVRVTLVDESRVYHIEGTAPEGVEIGDVAHYFNAESGNTMQVVSWTGDEVEVFRGLNLPQDAIASAFNFPRGSPVGSLSALSRGGMAADSYNNTSRFVSKAVGVLIAAAIAFAGYSFWRAKRPASGGKTPAVASALVLGTSGKLNGKNYRIRSHAVVEIAEVGFRFDRHEYRLVDDDGVQELLIHGPKPGAKDWLLYTPLNPLNPLTPVEAAALRVGATVNLQGYVAPVSEIFQSLIRHTEGEEQPDSKTGSVSFGFGAQSGSIPLTVRWNEGGITFYSGRNLSAKEVAAAFSQKTRN